MKSGSQYRSTKESIVVLHNKNEIPYIAAPHLHSSYEIYYNIRGAEGFMVGGKAYRCTERNLIVIPKILPHKAIVPKNVEYERCIINLSEHAADLIDMITMGSEATAFLHGGPLMVNLDEESHARFMTLISQYNAAEKEGGRLLAFSSFLALFDFLRHAFSGAVCGEYLAEDALSYVDSALLLIERDFKRITVSDIAERVHVGADHINRVFKEACGIQIKQYLTMRKIAEAKKYLYLGKSVKEACALAGFGDYANFLRTFKKQEGYPPGELCELSDPV